MKKQIIFLSLAMIMATNLMGLEIKTTVKNSTGETLKVKISRCAMPYGRTTTLKCGKYGIPQEAKIEKGKKHTFILQRNVKDNDRGIDIILWSAEPKKKFGWRLRKKKPKPPSEKDIYVIKSETYKLHPNFHTVEIKKGKNDKKYTVDYKLYKHQRKGHNQYKTEPEEKKHKNKKPITLEKIKKSKDQIDKMICDNLYLFKFR